MGDYLYGLEHRNKYASCYSEMEGGKYFFNIVKEGDQVVFATDDESERTLWVQAIYRATGQSHKPVPPNVQQNKISNTQLSRMQGGEYPRLQRAMITVAC